MDICIVKSASRDVYFQQNLKLMRLMQGEEIILRYRSVWADENICEAIQTGRCQATLASCDPPDLTLVPIRRLEIYGADITTESIALFTRCGEFVDPEQSEDWRKRFRKLYPTAGSPEGKFLVSLEEIGLCPSASEDVQPQAWQSLVDDLVADSHYRDCFFFYNKGLFDASGKSLGNYDLEVGGDYYLEVLSHNKHLPESVLDSSRLLAIADENIVLPNLDIETVPAHCDFRMSLRPIAAGKTRVEIGVAGSDIKTSRIRIDLECHSIQKATRLSKLGIPTAGLDAKERSWQVYRTVQQKRPDDKELLATILSQCFDAADRSDPRIAQETVRVLHLCGEHMQCASLLNELPETTLQGLSGEAHELLILSHCIARHVFPINPALSSVDFTDRSRQDRFQKMVASLPPEAAVEVVLSVLRGYRDVFMDEQDIGELFTLTNVCEGFRKTSDIRFAAEWLYRAGLMRTCHNFLVYQASLPQGLDDIDMLKLAIQAGIKSEGSLLPEIVRALVELLLRSGHGDDAVDAIKRYKKYIPASDLPFLLQEACENVTSQDTKAWTLLEAAETFRKELEFENARVCLYKISELNRFLGDENLEQAIAEEMTRVEDAEAQFSTKSDIEVAIAKIKPICRDRHIAVVGGVRRPNLANELQKILETKVEWFASTKMAGLAKPDALMQCIKKGRTALVIQLHWSRHCDTEKAKNECNNAGIPFIFVTGTNVNTVVRRIAAYLEKQTS